MVNKILVISLVFVFFVPNIALSDYVKLPQTGQTTCYNSGGTDVLCSGTGQDGEIRAGVFEQGQRFVDFGDCLYDNLTRLTWAKNADRPNGTKTWQEALDYVASFNIGDGFCGHKDWRLPNVIELESVINAGQPDSGPWLMGQGFLGVRSNYYWSSTSFAGAPGYAWVIYIRSGDIYSRPKNGNYYVWPVYSPVYSSE
jgi:hypothetical protein